MKFLLCLFLGLFFLAPPSSSAQSGGSVSLDFFYESLDPYGDWREVGDYGYCWQPRNVGPDWSPYSDGRWLYSDVGWTWDSDEPYGWAVYHYGRWANVASIGWIWVPGTDWGPGWVSWRHNSQYIGWAPLPPEARFQISIGFSSWVDDYYGIGPGHYRFVENRHFGSRRLGSVFIDQSQNYNIINQTTNITNIRYENNIVHNDGPRYADLSRMSSDPIPRYQLQRRQQVDAGSPRHDPETHRSRVQGDSLSVFAPPLDARQPSSGPGRRGGKVDDVRINRGWDRVGSPDEIAALRTRIKGNVEAPKDLPPRPHSDRGIDRPEGTPPVTRADRPPGPRGSDAKDKPRLPGSPPRDTPPSSQNPGSKRPEMKKPETQKPQPPPQTKRPSAPKPETRRPESKKPDLGPTMPDPRKPQSQAPPTKKPQSPRPEMKKPETQKPQPPPPQTKRPSAPKPETRRPESQRPETRTKKPDSRKPDASAPPSKKTEASRPEPKSRLPAPVKPSQKKPTPKDDKPEKKKSEAETN